MSLCAADGLCAAAMHLIHERFQPFRPELERIFGGSPPGEFFFQSERSFILGGRDHILSHGIKYHQFACRCS
jgi:hypothetical protein